MSQQRTVLIIDDSQADCELYRRYLRQDSLAEYQIAEAHLGQEGIDKWLDLQPDVVILDHFLPDMDSVEILKILQTKTHQPFFPVIVVTGTGDEAIAVQTIKLGAQDYLVKGHLTAKKLCQVVNTTLEAVQIRLELQQSRDRQQQAEAALRRANEELEQRVLERTAELQRVNQELQESEARYRTLSTFAPIGIFQTDQTGQAIYTNPCWQSIAGLTLDQSLGDGWIAAVYPDDRTAVLQKWQTCVQQGRDFSMEFRFLTAIGQMRWVRSRATPLYDETGAITGYVGTDEDISEQHVAFLELQQAEAELKQISTALSHAVEGISQLDLQGHYVRVNQSYASTVGYSPDEMVGMNWQITVHPDDLDRMNAAYQLMLETGKVEVEARGVRRDGSIFYKQLNMVSIYNSDGAFIGHYCFMKDISDRKQVEAALQASEERWQYALEGSGYGVWDWNVQTNEVFFSRCWKAMLGYAEAEVGNRLEEWEQRVHPDDKARVQQDLYRHLQGETAQYISEHRVLCKNGSYKWVLDRGKVMTRTPDGQPLRVIGTHTDISDRKQAEQQIQEQAALLNVASDAIFVRNLDDQVLFWNQGAERLYGWQAPEILGKSAIEHLCYQIAAQMRDILAIVIKTGEWQGELQKQTRSGQSVTISTRMTLVRDEAGNPKAILTVDTDITEKQLLESQFLRAQRLESLGTLASGIAHDFNNILTPILATAQLLQRKLPAADAQTLRLLKMQEESARRGAELVQQILSFARGTEGKRIPVQMGYLLEEIAKVIVGTFPKSIELEKHIPSQDLWLILADSTQLHQVVMNLCVNARDAMPNGGKLTLSAENLEIDECYARIHLDAHAGAYVLMTIADTGCGIVPEILDQIFDPFFTTKELGQGTGLGLATVMSIVKKHGGFLTVQSQVGQGTCFKVYIPAIATTSTLLPEVQPLPLGNGEQILIIEDEFPIREVTQTVLEAYNYRVLTAANGIEALALYTEQSTAIDLVLTDMMMPTMSGELTIATLHRLNPKLKIIAMSGRMTRDRFNQLNQVGVAAFLSKPYTTEDLLHVIQQVLQTQGSAVPL